MSDSENLPVNGILAEFRRKFADHNKLILSAAPGAGKTSVIPRAASECVSGEIRLIEPRRVAARAAACRIAELDGSPVGDFAGYAVRGETEKSSTTRVLALTPGILIREFQRDPALENVDVIIFDEFHERSWECDLLLAFALDVQSALRPELKIIIMSATLSEQTLAGFLPDAAVISCPGREFPVETVFRPSACSSDPAKIVQDTVRATFELFRSSDGDILVFLPGAGEIASAGKKLAGILPDSADIRQLHGALEFREQKKILASSGAGRRRVFLATNLAESSITIDGITAVVDCGWEKRVTYSPDSGMSFLELQRISRASADQRAGRAGRTAPGTAVRLYSKVEYNNFAASRPPEITVCELGALALHLAEWGADANDLRWLDAPPAAGMELACDLLRKLGAVDEKRRLTDTGRKLNAFPLHPRLGSMLLHSKELGAYSTAAAIAAVLENRVYGRGTADIRECLIELKKYPERYQMQWTVIRQLKGQGDIDIHSAGRLLAFAYPEWIAQSRERNGTGYRLAGGRAGVLDPDDPLRGSEFLAVAALRGSSGRDAGIILAAPLEKEELLRDFSDFTERVSGLDIDPDSGKVSAYEELRLDSLVLESHPVPPPPGAAGKAVLESAVKRKIALPPENFKRAVQLIDRIRFAFASEPDAGFPDWREDNWNLILAELTCGRLDQVRSVSDLLKLDWDAVTAAAVPHEQTALLNRLYPEYFITPRGYKVRIDYSGTVPSAAVRIQELYGLKKHPSIGRKQIPLRLELLSPAGRPVQVTMDLPGFWTGSWTLVRKDMRGRYPKHNWPEHPEDFC